MAGVSGTLGAISKVMLLNASKETVESMRKRVQPFRPDYYCVTVPVTVTHDIASVCLNAKAMEDYTAEYQSFVVQGKWKWRLVSSTRLDMDKAWIRPTKLEFWAVEGNKNIGHTYCWHFENCLPSELPKVEIGSVGEMLDLGQTFRDGDLCYRFQTKPSCLMVYKLFYITTIHGKSRFVNYGTHKWVPYDLADWKATIENLVGVHYFNEQPGSMKVFQQ